MAKCYFKLQKKYKKTTEKLALSILFCDKKSQDCPKLFPRNVRMFVCLSVILFPLVYRASPPLPPCQSGMSKLFFVILGEK